MYLEIKVVVINDCYEFLTEKKTFLERIGLYKTRRYAYGLVSYLLTQVL